MGKKIIKLKKKPVGRPPEDLAVIAERAEIRTANKLKNKLDKKLATLPNSDENVADARKIREYHEFLYWLALPIDLRGEKTQKEFAKKIGVGEDTLSDWKKREGFHEELNDLRRAIFSERASNVLRAVERRALGPGGNQDAALFFKATGVIKDQTDLKLGVDEDLKKALDRVAKALPD